MSQMLPKRFFLRRLLHRSRRSYPLSKITMTTLVLRLLCHLRTASIPRRLMHQHLRPPPSVLVPTFPPTPILSHLFLQTLYQLRMSFPRIHPQHRNSHHMHNSHHHNPRLIPWVRLFPYPIQPSLLNNSHYHHLQHQRHQLLSGPIHCHRLPTEQPLSLLHPPRSH